MEAAFLKPVFSRGNLLLLWTLAACSGGKAGEAVAKPEPQRQPTQTVWAGSAGPAWMLLRPRDPDPETRRFHAAIDRKLLEIPEGSALYQVTVCNFSDKEEFSLPVDFSISGESFLPLKSPPTEQGKLLWRALGGSRENLALAPQKAVQFCVSGPEKGINRPEIRSKLGGNEFVLRPQRVSFEDLEEFEKGPKKSFFLGMKENH